MCAQVLPLILSAAGSAVQAVDSNRAASDRDAAAREGIRRNRAAGAEGSRRIAEETRKLASSNPDGERVTAQQNFMDSLKRNLATPASPAGGVSSRFAQESGEAAAASEAENRGTAANLARIDAPISQRIREGVNVQNAGIDLSLLANRTQGQDFLTRLRMSLASPNPGAQGAGDFLTGFGQAAAQRAPRTPKTAVPVGQSMAWGE